MRRGEAGYTLVELLVVITIFSVVMILICLSFDRIVASSGKMVKAAETDIGGLIGLELLRVDLGLAGFGLPFALGGASYSEATGAVYSEDDVLSDGNGFTPVPSQFNDTAPNPLRAPRAFALGKGDLTTNNGFNGSDYLVLKGTALGLTRTSRRWTYLTYSSLGSVQKPSKSELELDPKNKEMVTVLNNGVRGGLAVRDLVTSGTSFYTSFNGSIPAEFVPKSRQDSYLVYGVAETGPLHFPFNRADYFLDCPPDGISALCAHASSTRGAGMLYRGMVSQGDGSLAKLPILDCVADFQVVFLNQFGVPTDIDFPDDPDPAQQIRNEVSEVRVYILAQQGKIDPQYSYPFANPEAAILVGDPAFGVQWNHTWSQSDLLARLGKDWQHYHWKLYTIVVQPKNLE